MPHLTDDDLVPMSCSPSMVLSPATIPKVCHKSTAAKAGLSMLPEVAALELTPQGIRVNGVAPGFVHTPLTEPANHIPGVVDEYIENTPLGRAGTPEDIADAVVFLCKAPWLTGEVLDLNGGAHMKRYPDLMSHVMKLAAQ